MLHSGCMRHAQPSVRPCSGSGHAAMLRPAPAAVQLPLAAGPRRARRTSARVTCRSVNNVGFDNGLALGDAVMITATELASDRIPLSEAGLLAAIMLGAWIGVGVVKGDYRVGNGSDDVMMYNMMLLEAMMGSMTTWMLAVPAALAVYSYLVPGQIVDAAVLSTSFSAHRHALPPQLEVMLADLVTLCCWRGVYSVFRMF